MLDTLVFDGKVERNVKENNKKFYISIERLAPTTGLVRIPCGICPISSEGGTGENPSDVTPLNFRVVLKFFEKICVFKKFLLSKYSP